MAQLSRPTSPAKTDHNSDDEYDRGGSWLGAPEVAEAQRAAEARELAEQQSRLASAQAPATPQLRAQSDAPATPQSGAQSDTPITPKRAIRPTAIAFPFLREFAAKREEDNRAFEQSSSEPPSALQPPPNLQPPVYTRSSISPFPDQAQYTSNEPSTLVLDASNTSNTPQLLVQPHYISSYGYQHAFGHGANPYAHFSTQPSFFAAPGPSGVPPLPPSTQPQSSSLAPAPSVPGGGNGVLPLPPSTQPRSSSLGRELPPPPPAQRLPSAQSQSPPKGEVNGPALNQSSLSSTDPGPSAATDTSNAEAQGAAEGDVDTDDLSDLLDEAKLVLLDQPLQDFFSSRSSGRPSKENVMKIKEAFAKTHVNFRELSTATGISVPTLLQKFFAVVNLVKAIQRGANPWNTYNRYARTGEWMLVEMARLIGSANEWDGSSVPTYQQVQASYKIFRDIYGDKKVKEIMELWDSSQELRPGQEKGARLRAFDTACAELEELGDRYRNFHQINLFGVLVGGRVGTDQSLRHIYDNFEASGFLDRNLVLEGPDAFVGAFQTHVMNEHLENVSTQQILTLCEARGLTVTGPGIDNLKGKAPVKEPDAVGKLQQVIIALAAENKITFPRRNQLPWDTIAKLCVTVGFQLYNYPIGVTEPWNTAKEAKARKPGQKDRRQGIKGLTVAEQMILLDHCRPDAKDRFTFRSVKPLDVALGDVPLLVFAPDKDGVRKEVFVKNVIESVPGLVEEDITKTTSTSSKTATTKTRILGCTTRSSKNTVKQEQADSAPLSQTQHLVAASSDSDDSDFYMDDSSLETPKATKTTVPKRKTPTDGGKLRGTKRGTKRQKTSDIQTSDADTGMGNREHDNVDDVAPSTEFTKRSDGSGSTKRSGSGSKRPEAIERPESNKRLEANKRPEPKECDDAGAQGNKRPESASVAVAPNTAKTATANPPTTSVPTAGFTNFDRLPKLKSGQSISGADIFGEHLTPSSSSAQPSRPKPIPVSENLRKLKACLAATAPAANLSNSKVASPAPATASSTSACAPTQSALPSPHPSTPSVSAPPQPAVSSSPAPQIQMDTTVDTTMDTNQSVHPVPPPIGPANHPAQGQWQAGPGFQYPPMFPHHPVQQPQQFQGPLITHPPSQNQPYLGQGQYGVQVQPGFVQLPPGVTPEILTGLMQFMGANGWGGGGMGGAGNNPNAGGGHQ
ncbi:hypothetical protein PQX77_006584 [Marasmius sp. AFHP31]|nr:hypothetical protein PQX77_006584 [Marasmius sp. AFHP31]